MNKQLLVDSARDVIRAAHFKYYSINNDAVDLKIAQRRNEIAFAECERTVAIMERVINRVQANKKCAR